MTTNRTDADMTADEIAQESQSAVDPARELLERIQKSRVSEIRGDGREPGAQT